MIWAVSLSTNAPSRTQSDSLYNNYNSQFDTGQVIPFDDPHTRSECFTYNYFNIMVILTYVSQNISYLSLLSLSPLTLSHPKFLQQLLVQPSTPPVTTRFSLDNVISLSFGSYKSDSCKIKFTHLFTLTYIYVKLATNIYSLAHYTKGKFFLNYS